MWAGDWLRQSGRIGKSLSRDRDVQGRSLSRDLDLQGNPPSKVYLGEPSLEDVLVEVRGLRMQVDALQRQDSRMHRQDSRKISGVRGAPASATWSAPARENSLPNPTLLGTSAQDVITYLEDAFTRERMMRESAESLYQSSLRRLIQDSSQLVQRVDQSLGEQLREMSQMIFDLLERKVDELRPTLEKSVMVGLNEELNQNLKAELDNALRDTKFQMQLKTALDTSLEDHEARLKEHIAKSSDGNLFRTRLPASSRKWTATTNFTQFTENKDGTNSSKTTAMIHSASRSPRKDGIDSEKEAKDTPAQIGGNDTPKTHKSEKSKGLNFGVWPSEKNWKTMTTEQSVHSRDLVLSWLMGPGVSTSNIGSRLTLTDLLDSNIFCFLTNLVILWNCVWLAVTASARTEDLLSQHHVWVGWDVQGLPVSGIDIRNNTTSHGSRLPAHIHDTNILEIVLLSVLSVEIALRILARPQKFFRGTHWRYNILDAGVCFITAVDFIVCACLGYMQSRHIPNLTFLRICRLTRALVESKDSRVYQFFRTLFKSVISSIGLVWCACAMMLLLFFSFAMILNHGIQTILTSSSGSLKNSELTSIAEAYGNMPITMLSLSMAVTGGSDWSTAMRPLRKLPWIYTLVYILFIAFSIFGVLNVVTGIFVEYAMQVTQSNKKEKIRGQLRQRQDWEVQIKKIFQQADQDKSGTLSWQEFRHHIKHPVITAYFQSLELDPTEAKGLFTLLDLTGEGEIPVEDFVHGCSQLKGEAKSIDLASLRYDFMRFYAKFKEFSKVTKIQLGEIQEALSFGCSATLSQQIANGEDELAKGVRSISHTSYEVNEPPPFRIGASYHSSV